MTGWVYWIAAIAVMALVTYVPRVLPLTLVRRRIESPFLRSFLYYMPFAVLGAMTFPAVLYATSTPVSAAVGLLVALGMAFWGKQLLPVALASTAAVLLSETLMRLLHWL